MVDNLMECRGPGTRLTRNKCLSHRFRGFPTGKRVARRLLGCYSQEVATRRCTKRWQQVANESRLCYSQKVETKAVGLPAAVGPPQERRTPSHFDQARKRRS